MTAARGRRGRFWRGRVALATAGAVGAVAVGVGVAEASGHGWWDRSRRGSASAAAGPAGTHRDGSGRHDPSRDPRRHVPPTTTSSPGPGGSPSAHPGPSGAPADGPTGRPTGGPSTGPTGRPTGGAPVPGTAVRLPPANVGVDYQIGEPYPVPAGVGVVSRDHGAQPAPGVYNICYVNAFQTQTSDAAWWKRAHPDLLLTSGGGGGGGVGGYVTDSEWNELLLDVSTAQKRAALLQVIRPWIDECAAKGFDALEPDNMDSWTRSNGRLTRQQALDFIALVTAYAHGKGLAVAQKNALELGAAGRSQGKLDFAIAEECADYTMDDGQPECQGYVNVYGNHVIVLEYDQDHFRQACTRFGPSLSVTRRDVDVSARGASAYAFGIC